MINLDSLAKASKVQPQLKSNVTEALSGEALSGKDQAAAPTPLKDDTFFDAESPLAAKAAKPAAQPCALLARNLLQTAQLTLARQFPGAHAEPIPTQWPNAKFEKIPTDWPDLKKLPVGQPSAASAEANTDKSK